MLAWLLARARSEVNAGRTSALALAERLGPALTDASDAVRARGVLLLAEVLSRLPALPLDAPAAAALATFFRQRLRDAA